MAVLRFPSDQFPRYPELSLAQPEGWLPLPDVGLPLALIKDVPPGEFRANVIAVISRFGAGYRIEQAISEVVTRLEPMPEYSEVDRDSGDILGYPGFRIEGAYRDERAGTLVQAVRLVLVDRGPVRDLVQLTGSCAGCQVEHVLSSIREIQDSLTIS